MSIPGFLNHDRQLADGILARLAAQGVRPTGVADDSRQVRPGDLFLAYPGYHADGRRYIGAALAAGAVAVVWECGAEHPAFAWQADWPVPQCPVAGLRAQAGIFAHILWGEPSGKMKTVAFTGTNGKTTTTQWFAQAYPEGRCAVVGTLGVGFPGELENTGFTTPEATTLARCLAGFAERGGRACALEASSIGIEEGRMNGLRLECAVLTNLTRDHLDYHGSMAAYGEAKARLFQWPGLRSGVFNLDDPFGRELAARSRLPLRLGYTLTNATAPVEGILRPENLRATPEGYGFDLVTPEGRHPLELPVVGRYNLANLLAVIAALMAVGHPLARILPRLAGLQPPAGRMERVPGPGGSPLVVVDYAHTPDALASALDALREQARARDGRLLCLFGCGGDRDPGKRPVMGRLAVELADRVWITSDNPRSEDPAAILRDIITGLPDPAAVQVEADRRQAIAGLLAEADARDVVLLAGKGHETYQEIKGVKYHLSDREEAEQALAARVSKGFPRGQEGQA